MKLKFADIKPGMVFSSSRFTSEIWLTIVLSKIEGDPTLIDSLRCLEINNNEDGTHLVEKTVTIEDWAYGRNSHLARCRTLIHANRLKKLDKRTLMKDIFL